MGFIETFSVTNFGKILAKLRESDKKGVICVISLFKCKCGQVRTTVFGFGPCKNCGGDAIYKIDKE